jgi:hypothetical protein
MPSILVFNANNPRTQRINEENFEILSLKFIFALFNNAFASKFQLSILPGLNQSETFPNLFFIFTDF